jgi:hypothetical protein
MRPMKKTFLPLLLLLLLAGCNSNNTITVGLKVELTNIARSSDGTTEVSWRIVNPNISSYLVDETTHKLFLNDTLIGTIHDKGAVAIPAQNNVSRTTRLVSAGAAGERALVNALATGSAAYRTDSTIVIRLYGESTDKSSLTSTGKVTVTTK